ncbi:MAG: histidinol-phosphate transaminase [Nitrospirae bacterium]|nr:histidinol-phosphate transaminase [Nitrospirota bacterium]
MKKVDIRKLVKPSVRTLRAYEAKEIPCRVKLDANESPYAWDPAKFAGVSSGIKTNRYPDPEAKQLRRIVGKRFDVSPESVLPGNGSDELIYYLITAFGGPVLYPVPTFSMYGIISQALGERGIAVPLDEDFDLPLEKMLRATRKEKPKLIFLSSPNNPTGNCFSADRIMKIIEKSNGIVVVDEAYQPFSSAKGFLPLLEDYRNLVIMRTLSKIGLAALRLGFLVASPELLAEVNKVRLPFNVNSFSQAMAATVLGDPKRLTASVRAVVSERGRLLEEMKKTEGVTPFPSEANFILFRVKNAGELYQALLKKGILVRNMEDGIRGCLRVTVGTPRENSAFLKVLRSALER